MYRILNFFKKLAQRTSQGKSETAINELIATKQTAEQNAYKEVLAYAKSINGVSADEWCKKVYSFVESHCTESSASSQISFSQHDIDKLNDIIIISKNHCMLDIQQREFLEKLKEKLQTII